MQKVLREGLARRGHGSQSELARHLDVVPQTVNKWVKGHNAPEMFRWPAIEEFLALPPGSMAEAAGIMPLDAESDRVPPAIAEMLRRLGDEIALLRSEVAELRDEDRQRQQASDPVPPAHRTTP